MRVLLFSAFLFLAGCMFPGHGPSVPDRIFEEGVWTIYEMNKTDLVHVHRVEGRDINLTATTTDGDTFFVGAQKVVVPEPLVYRVSHEAPHGLTMRFGSSGEYIGGWERTKEPSFFVQEIELEPQAYEVEFRTFESPRWDGAHYLKMNWTALPPSESP